MTDQPATPPTEQVFGAAKKICLEIEKYPLQTEAAIVGMLRLMLDHRQITLQNEMQQTQKDAQEAAMADARAAHAKAQLQREEDERIRKLKAEHRASGFVVEARDAATGGLALVDATGQPYTQVETPSEPEAVPASA